MPDVDIDPVFLHGLGDLFDDESSSGFYPEDHFDFHDVVRGGALGVDGGDGEDLFEAESFGEELVLVFVLFFGDDDSFDGFEAGDSGFDYFPTDGFEFENRVVFVQGDDVEFPVDEIDLFDGGFGVCFEVVFDLFEIEIELVLFEGCGAESDDEMAAGETVDFLY